MWNKWTLSKEVSSQCLFNLFIFNVERPQLSPRTLLERCWKVWWIRMKAEISALFYAAAGRQYWLDQKSECFHHWLNITTLGFCFLIFTITERTTVVQMWVKPFSALMQFWPLDQTESLAQSLTVGQWPLCPAWLFPAVSQLREYKDTQRVSQTDWLMTVCQLSVLFVSLITDSYSSLSVLLCTSECIGRD